MRRAGPALARFVGAMVLMLVGTTAALGGDDDRSTIPAVASTSTSTATSTAAAARAVSTTTSIPPTTWPRGAVPPPAFLELNAGGPDLPVTERALAILRRHGALATRRHGPVWRPGPNQVKRLSINVCSACAGAERLGTAQVEKRWRSVGPGGNLGVVQNCVLVLNMPLIREVAADWRLPVTHVVAMTLAHEQEHCLRFPDDRERPAVDAEVRLAREIGGAALIDYATSGYALLDERGYWERDP